MIKKNIFTLLFVCFFVIFLNCYASFKNGQRGGRKCQFAFWTGRKLLSEVEVWEWFSVKRAQTKRKLGNG